MSLYFDLVISCDLKEDTPEAYINAIRCLTDRDYELSETPELIHLGHDDIPAIGNIWDHFWDHHFLAHDPERLVTSNFRKMLRLIIPTENNREVYNYSLQFSGRSIHDDHFVHHHMLFLYWFGSIAVEGLIGYYKDIHEERPTMLYAKNGGLKEVECILEP